MGAVITGLSKAVDFKVAQGELKDEVEKLINQLSDMDKLESAKERLIEIGRSATELLIEALKDTNDLVRKETAYLLGLIGGNKVIDPLIESLKDPITSVQIASAEALGRLGAGQARSTLHEIVRENLNPILTAACRLSLRQIAEMSATAAG